MAALYVTKDSGGKTRPAPMTTLEPGQEQSVEALANIAQGLAVNGVGLADLLSEIAMMERMAAKLSLAASLQTRNADLRETYQGLELEHVAQLAETEQLMKRAGVDPRYVSPSARVAEVLAQRIGSISLLAGSVDALTMERATLDAMLLISTKCAENRQILVQIARRIPPSPLRRALRPATHRLGLASGPALRRAVTLRRSLVLGEVLETPEAK
ncbi:MAG: hypothetical protein QM820_04020 [Minicystis sp.]